VPESIWSRLKRLRISYQAFALFSPVSILAPVFGDFRASDTFLDLALELTLGLIATGTLGLTLLLLSPVWRNIPPSWIRLVVITIVIVMGGTARGFVLYHLGPILSFDVDTDLVGRILNSITSTYLWLTILSLFIEARDNFRSRFAAVVSQLIAVNSSKYSNSHKSELLNDVERSLRELQDWIPRKFNQGDLFEIASRLRTEVVERIRAHSSDLWEIRSVEAPGIRFAPLLRLATSRLNYSLGFLLGFYGIAGIGNLSSYIGFQNATIRVSIALVVLATAHLIYRKAIDKMLAPQLWLNLGYVLFLGSIVLVPMGFIELFASGSVLAIGYLLVLVALTAAIPVLESTLRISEIAREELLEFVSSLKDLQVEPGFRSMHPSAYPNARLASFLHNSLQAELQGIAFALERASVQPGNVGLGKATLERLRLLSARSLDQDFAEFESQPLGHLTRVIQGWRGILEIELDWTIDQGLMSDPKLGTVVQIIEEVASNSVTHGEATNLKAVVTVKDSGFQVRITNNGKWISNASQGFGSAWLRSFAREGTDRNPSKVMVFRV
jgi:hypothetical protein